MIGSCTSREISPSLGAVFQAFGYRCGHVAGDDVVTVGVVADGDDGVTVTTGFWVVGVMLGVAEGELCNGPGLTEVALGPPGQPARLISSSGTTKSCFPRIVLTSLHVSVGWLYCTPNVVFLTIYNLYR